jgi:hypothetical protein
VKEIIDFLASLKPEHLIGFRKALALDRAQYAVKTLDDVRSSFDSLVAMGPLRASEIFEALHDVEGEVIDAKQLECPCGVSLYEHADGTSIEEFLVAVMEQRVVIVSSVQSEEEIPAPKPTLH